MTGMGRAAPRSLLRYRLESIAVADSVFDDSEVSGPVTAVALRAASDASGLESGGCSGSSRLHLAHSLGCATSSSIAGRSSKTCGHLSSPHALSQTTHLPVHRPLIQPTQETLSLLSHPVLQLHPNAPSFSSSASSASSTFSTAAGFAFPSFHTRRLVANAAHHGSSRAAMLKDRRGRCSCGHW